MDENMIPMSVEDAYKTFGVEVPESIDHAKLSVDEAFGVFDRADDENALGSSAENE